jgi:hypothetical protein
MNFRTLAKRKSETDVTSEGASIPLRKRLLTEKIAAGMGVLSLNNSPQDAQGNSRPPFVRTTSTPSNFYNPPSFQPSRPDLVSSFELQRPYQSAMDEDQEMAYEPSPLSQHCTTEQQAAPPIYSHAKRHLLNNAPKYGNRGMPMRQNSQSSLYPIIEDEEPNEYKETKFKLLIPIPQAPSLDIPLLHNLANPDSRALILYTPPKEVIEQSLQRNNKEQATTIEPIPTTMQSNSTTTITEEMMLD